MYLGQQLLETRLAENALGVLDDLAECISIRGVRGKRYHRLDL